MKYFLNSQKLRCFIEPKAKLYTNNHYKVYWVCLCLWWSEMQDVHLYVNTGVGSSRNMNRTKFSETKILIEHKLCTKSQLSDTGSGEPLVSLGYVI